MNSEEILVPIPENSRVWCDKCKVEIFEKTFLVMYIRKQILY